MSEGRFFGPVALVTGAARPRGIGRATVTALSENARAITAEAVDVSAGQPRV